MSIQENVRIVKDFLAAIGRGDRQALLALSAENIEWIIPGHDWPLAGTHRGHAGLADLLRKASETMELSLMEPREFVAQGDHHWIFAITVRNGRLTHIREYIDTQALARARTSLIPTASGAGNSARGPAFQRVQPPEKAACSHDWLPPAGFADALALRRVV